MTSRATAPAALPILAWGTFGGLAASLFCFCWVISVPAGWAAVRWTARLRGGLKPGQGVLVGITTGLILGMVTASFGTVLFLKSLDPKALQESAAMASAMLGEDAEVSTSAAAMGHAFLAFWSNLFFGFVGGLLGAASVSRDAESASAAEPAWRFEPRTEAPAPVVRAQPRPTAPTEPDDEVVPREEVPPEAFQSAWRSTAASGTPRQAPKQAPPPSTDEHLPAARGAGDDDLEVLEIEDATVQVRAAGPPEPETIVISPATPRGDD